MSIDSIYRIPDKVRIINSTTKTPISFRDAAGAIATPLTATNLLIEGFGNFKLNEITSVTMSRGLAPTLETWSVTAANAPEITVVAPATRTNVWFEIELETVAEEAKNARNAYTFGRKLTYSITTNTGETAGSVLAKLYNAMFVTSSPTSTNKRFWLQPGAGTTGTFVNGVATNITVLQIQPSSRFDFIKSFKVTGDNYFPSSVVTIFNPVKTVAFNKGKNYGFDIETKEKSTAFNNWAYGYDMDEIPIKDALYTSIYFTYKSNRIAKQDSNLDNVTTFLVYLNQGVCEASIDDLTDFFNLISGSKLFNAIVTGVYTNNVTALQFKTNA